MSAKCIVPAIGMLLLLAGMAGRLPWLTAGEYADGPPAATPHKPLLLREGTQLRDEPGRFIASGNRLTFMASSGASVVGLENLNLERIGKIVTASPDPVDWFVTGTVTEYQGSNYLLVSRARRKPATPKNLRGF